MKNGRLWVFGLLALGSALALFAVTYWQRPVYAGRGAVKNFHTAIVRNKRDQALRLLAPRVTWNGREHSDRDFAAQYALPPAAGEIEALPCPENPAHMNVRMNALVYCFITDARGNFWRLHAVGSAPCPCRP